MGKNLSRSVPKFCKDSSELVHRDTAILYWNSPALYVPHLPRHFQSSSQFRGTVNLMRIGEWRYVSALS